MHNNKTAFLIGAILLLIFVVTAVDHHGNGGRIFAQGEAHIIIASPEQAYAVWQNNKVKGRILLLFDRYPHIKGFFSYEGVYEGAPQLSPTSLLEFSIFNNIIRKLYLIVPDAAWEEFRQQEAIHPIRKVPGLENGLYLGGLSGIPIIAVTPSSLPMIKEKTLVYINSRLFDEARVRELLSEKKISSDVIITSRGDLP